jgi:hypothetical protein
VRLRGRVRLRGHRGKAASAAIDRGD